ncbi:hypothetical protein J2808_004436 [Pseudarthrobacter sulfonivorans]|nr:hypothetical protein [Pseudarthrobacter sulfonivorans]
MPQHRPGMVPVPAGQVYDLVQEQSAASLTAVHH